jgi:5-methylcytosine-specific restriction enzyme A
MPEYKTREQKRKFYDSGNWKRIREEAKKKNNYECQRCKRNGYTTIDTNESNGKRKKIQLVVHHIKELEHHPDLALDIDNLEVQCVKCHNETHGRTFERKENPWEGDEKW